VDNTSDLDKPISTAAQTALNDKVDKVQGKGLSTNDYTDAEKQKLANIESNAQANVQSDWNEDDTEDDGYIKNKPNLSTSLTATGNPITIESSESNLVECVAEVEAVQEGSGDPSPDNIRHIIGQTEVVIDDVGKNIIDISKATLDTQFPQYFTLSAPRSDALLLKAGTYTVSISEPWEYNLLWINASTDKTTWYDIWGDGHDVNHRATTSLTFTTSSDIYVVVVFGTRHNGWQSTPVATVQNAKPQIELGSTATEYEPYKGKTYTIQLGNTIYGGELDVLTGKMRVTHGYEEFDGSSDENWAKYSSGSASAYDKQTTLSNLIAVSDDDKKVKIIANELESVAYNGAWGEYDAFVCKNNTTETSGLVTGVRSITTVADWRTYLASNPLQVVYELATPYTIQLTPQQIRLLKGTNHLSCNTGDLTIKYYPDNVLGQLKGDIEKGLNAYYDYQIQALWDKIGELQA
jgi:hypothetical protein